MLGTNVGSAPGRLRLLARLLYTIGLLPRLFQKGRARKATTLLMIRAEPTFCIRSILPKSSLINTCRMAGPGSRPTSPPLHTPPHTLLEPRLPSRRSVVPPPLDAWREGSTQSAGPGGNAHRLHEGLHGELQEELQREAGRRADAEERARGERRRAELAEDAAAAAEAQARGAVLEAAATRQAMAEAEAEQRRAMAEAEAERGRAAQLQQALQTSRAEAARLRVQLHQARRAAAQQPPTAAGRHAGGAGSTGGVGSRAAPQGWMASQARLRSEGQSRELAQLTRQMRQRALRHALRVLTHWPG